jgi:carbonic anhydrase
MLTRRTVLFVLFALLIAALGIGAVAAQETPPHWTYEGEEGPEHWGALDTAYAACATGVEQSPIDLTSAEAFDLVDVQTDYHESALTILNNGHTIQANYDAGSAMTVNGDTYELKQFHFHTPSEHTIDGEAFPLEVHFVHADADGHLAVIGVMLVEGDADNAAFAPVFDAMPAEEAEAEAVEGAQIDANAMLPENQLYYTYRGSLTTPPCSEGVRWIVMTTPVELSAAQIEAFHAIFELNARPVQPLNTRGLLLDSESGS